MQSKHMIFPLALLMVAVFLSTGSAVVEQDVRKTLQIKAEPLDVAVSQDGRWIYVLTDPGKIMIYSADGQLKDTVSVGSYVDQIKTGPWTDILLLSSRQKRTVEILALEFSYQINTAQAPFKGPEDAPVVITVFSDFQCKYCARLVPLLEQVLDQNPDQVKLVFKNFPLRSHQYAGQAAVAALAAETYGKFWEFHDRLFANFNRLDENRIKHIAKELGFDSSKFEKKMKDTKILAKVRQDIKDGVLAGVQSTPTVFINGKRLKQRSLKGFQILIDQELKKIKAAGETKP